MPLFAGCSIGLTGGQIRASEAVEEAQLISAQFCPRKETITDTLGSVLEASSSFCLRGDLAPRGH